MHKINRQNMILMGGTKTDDGTVFVIEPFSFFVAFGNVINLPTFNAQ